MHWIDLTRLMTADMPVFPGTRQPSLNALAAVSKNGYCETELQFSAHAGTHMDAPGHVLEGAPLLDQLPVNLFLGTGFTVDCRAAGENGEITLPMLQAAGEEARKADFLLLYTGWERYWGQEAYFSGFPCLTREAAAFLQGKKGVGIDAISFDPVHSRELPIHKALLGQHILLVENLCSLEKTLGQPFLFCALPLHYEKAEGAPVRAVAGLQSGVSCTGKKAF